MAFLPLPQLLPNPPSPPPGRWWKGEGRDEMAERTDRQPHGAGGGSQPGMRVWGWRGNQKHGQGRGWPDGGVPGKGQTDLWVGVGRTNRRQGNVATCEGRTDRGRPGNCGQMDAGATAVQARPARPGPGRGRARWRPEREAEAGRARCLWSCRLRWNYEK